MTTMLDRDDDVVRRFAQACRTGDTAELRRALDPDVVAACDGGGRMPAASGPVYGADDVAELVAALLSPTQPDVELTFEAVNGQAGLALRRAGRAVAVVAVGTARGKVSLLFIVLNPAKLGGWHRS
jgi:RNA polymerase sigma-70 factor (ECF subfamily)